MHHRQQLGPLSGDRLVRLPGTLVPLGNRLARARGLAERPAVLAARAMSKLGSPFLFRSAACARALLPGQSPRWTSPPFPPFLSRDPASMRGAAAGVLAYPKRAAAARPHPRAARPRPGRLSRRRDRCGAPGRRSAIAARADLLLSEAYVRYASPAHSRQGCSPFIRTGAGAPHSRRATLLEDAAAAP